MDVLGDAVVTSALLETLHNAFPNGCTIDILCHAYNYIGFKYNKFINKCYVLDDHVIGSKKLSKNFVYRILRLLEIIFVLKL